MKSPLLTCEYHVSLALTDFERLQEASVSVGVTPSVIVRQLLATLATLSPEAIRQIPAIRSKRPVHTLHLRLSNEVATQLATRPELRDRLAPALRAMLRNYLDAAAEVGTPAALFRQLGVRETTLWIGKAKGVDAGVNKPSMPRTYEPPPHRVKSRSG